MSHAAKMVYRSPARVWLAVIKDNDLAFYMDVAIRASKRSKAERLKVGAVIVNPDHVMAAGYNGTPSGCDNTCEDVGVDGELVSRPEVIHAELNALFKFVNNGISTKGSAVFITHSPCLDCAKALYLAKIELVCYGTPFRSDDGIRFLQSMGVEVKQVTGVC